MNCIYKVHTQKHKKKQVKVIEVFYFCKNSEMYSGHTGYI